jgi:hypothetical protein
MTQAEFAKACGLGLPTIQRVEAATVTPRTKTYAGLDRGAGWPPGSARRTVEDGSPPREIEMPPAPTHEWSAAERQQMQGMTDTEVHETYEMFLRRSAYLAQVWMREVTRVRAEAEQAKAVTDG